jgi:HD-GYP domain-containing protein (c-di-GMP phosphodiesterase class II)
MERLCAHPLKRGEGNMEAPTTPREDLEKRIKQLEMVALGISLAYSEQLESEEDYTIGQERRVGELVSAIAAELAIPKEEITGILIAALLRDIGKVAVPSEICGKPDLFTEMEFKLIQSHSQEGYQMLQAIPFPWPVAEAVLQHHERLDGSGYPQGLAGEAILPAARIVAVADVVVAMVSPRPYRPALPLSTALEELSENRGILYDPAAVDACVRLFQEKDFAFSEPI